MTELAQKLISALGRLVVATTKYEKAKLAERLITRTHKLTKEQRSKLNELLEFSPRVAYLRARKSKDPEERAKLQQVVLDTKDPHWAYNFAGNIPGADIEKLQQIVLDAKDLEWVYSFAANVKGADIEALQQIILDARDPVWAHVFADDVKGSDRKALKQIYQDHAWS